VKIIDCEQGSTEWKMARMGLPTASQFGRIIGKKLTLVDGAWTYMNELLVEWALGYCEGEDASQYMERGREMEEQAVAFFELQSGLDTQKVGFITNDAGTVGCSPDRLVGDDGGLEVKCPAAKTHIGYLLSAGDVGPYAPQVQGALWITGREWWTWLSFHPTLPPAEVRMARDEKFIAALASALDEFNDRLADAKARILATGFVPAELQVQRPEHGPIPSDILV
jgi:hypothetical protein